RSEGGEPMIAPRPLNLDLTVTLDPAAPADAMAGALAEAGAPGETLPVSDDAQAFRDGAVAMHAALRLLLRRGWMGNAELARRGTDRLPCPDVPLVHYLHAAAFSTVDAAGAYARPDALMSIP